MDYGFFIFGVLVGAFFTAMITFGQWSASEIDAIEKGFAIMKGDKYRLERVD